MGNLGGSASDEIDAPLDEVWAVVEDVLTAPEWQGGLDAMSALEHDGEGRATVVETESDIKVKRVKARVRFSYDGPTRLSWTQEQGDMKSVQGAWELEDLGAGRTRAFTRLTLMSLSVSTTVARPSPSCSSALMASRPPCHSGAVSTSSTTAHTSSRGASISSLALPPRFPITILLCRRPGHFLR